MNWLEPEGRFWGLCTPWHPDDLNAHLKTNPGFALLRRAIGPDGESIWPEKWPREALLQRRDEIGEVGFARGYRLVAMAEGDSLLKAEWIGFHDGSIERRDCDEVVVAVDPAVGASSRSDASGVVVAGLKYGIAFVLSAQAWRLRVPDFFDQLGELDRLVAPDRILFESNAAFAGLRDLLQRRASFGAKVLGRPAAKSKDARIAALGVALQSGRAKLLGRGGTVDPSQRELFEELVAYPNSTHDDLADACAAAVEYLTGRAEPKVW